MGKVGLLHLHFHLGARFDVAQLDFLGEDVKAREEPATDRNNHDL